MKQVLWLMTLFALMAGGSVEGQGGKRPDPWEGLRFLLGTWEAKTTGGNAQAQGTGTYTFRLELKDHVLARHSGYEACKGPEDFNCEHGDLLYIYPEGAGLRAIYFDNEGHVIHYAVSVAKPGMVVMVSDPAGPGPQFRLTYELNGDLMAGKFEIKMPGKADFGTYLEWSGRRKE
jgi:hypothetical protein